MSGFGGKADMPIALRNVRYKADICVDRVFVPTRNDIRFLALSRHSGGGKRWFCTSEEAEAAGGGAEIRFALTQMVFGGSAAPMLASNSRRIGDEIEHLKSDRCSQYSPRCHHAPAHQIGVLVIPIHWLSVDGSIQFQSAGLNLMLLTPLWTRTAHVVSLRMVRCRFPKLRYG